MERVAESSQRQSLREQVELLLPAWQSWYPSLFHAAEDLGLIRARVCSLSSLMLSSRHAEVHNEAMQSFKEQWSVEDEPTEDFLPGTRIPVNGSARQTAPAPAANRSKRRRKKKRR